MCTRQSFPFVDMYKLLKSIKIFQSYDHKCTATFYGSQCKRKQHNQQQCAMTHQHYTVVQFIWVIIWLTLRQPRTILLHLLWTYMQQHPLTYLLYQRVLPQLNSQLATQSCHDSKQQWAVWQILPPLTWHILCFKKKDPETFYYNFAKIGSISLKIGTHNLHMM